MGGGFDPASATAIGTWVCRGWLILWPGRPAPNAITAQEYYLGVLTADNPSTDDQLVSSGTEGGVPSTVRSVLGGTGRLYGAILGALIFMLARDQLAGMNPQYWYFWIGLLLMAVVLVMPRGILGGLARLTGRRHAA